MTENIKESQRQDLPVVKETHPQTMGEGRSKGKFTDNINPGIRNGLHPGSHSLLFSRCPSFIRVNEEVAAGLS